jgi:hypothetical protein
LLPYFALTLFVSASLLFFVQPLVGKMILPRLGGTPAVWNTCMVFFQAVLLVGYAYTHSLSTWRDHRKQLLAHLVLLALPFLVLPFSLGDWNPPTERNPVFSVLWLLLGMVGLPFFVVSTSAPLLQRWFGHTGHPAAKDPYFLYGASNLGSMLALLLYPILIEPLFAVEDQARLWTVSYLVFALLVVGCVVLVWRPAAMLETASAGPATGTATGSAAPVAAEKKTETAIVARRGPGRKAVLAHAEAPAQPKIALSERTDRVTWLRRLRWIGLAAAPSSLMLGVTTYLTTDIAAIPFFWVIPLALYLLTFILVFARWPVVWTEGPHTFVLYAQPVALLCLLLFKLAHLNARTWGEFTLHLTAFFMTTLMCHGELAKDRPSTRHLTEFYLWMSFGGVLGGMFNALVAPVFFTLGVLEYPLAMILSCLCRPRMVSEFTLIPGDTSEERATPLGRALDLALPILLGLGTYAALYGLGSNPNFPRRYLMAGPLILVLALALRPLRFGLSLGLVMLAVWFYDRGTERPVFEDRGFFGFVKVKSETERHSGNTYHTLIHGGINHGQQVFEPASRRREPITYFHPTGGIGQIFDQYSWPDARLPASLAGLGALSGPLPAGVLVDLHSEPPYCVVGLGTGTLAAHARPWQRLHIYEIDPLVRKLSLPPEGETPSFTFVADAIHRGALVGLDPKGPDDAPEYIIMGDGRLRLRQAPERFYHIIVLDAFSSDAIPVHLLTADAVGEYLTKLADGGILVFNTTNRYVDITGVLATIAEHHRLECMTYGDYYEYNDKGIPDKFSSDWLVMRRRLPPGPTTGSLPLAERFANPRVQQYLRRHWLAIEREDLINRADLFAWKQGVPDGQPLWTDAFSNLFRVIHWK